MRFNRLRNLRYLKREVIFITDFVLSVLATFAAVLITLSLFNDIDSKSEIYLVLTSISVVISAILINVLGLHKSVIRYFSTNDMLLIILFSVLKSLVLFSTTIWLGYEDFLLHYLFTDLLLTAFLMISLRCFMISIYRYLLRFANIDIVDTFVYSTLSSNPELARQFNEDVNSKFKIRGFLSTSREKTGSKISGQKVYSLDRSEKDLLRLFNKKGVTAIVFTSSEHFKRAKSDIVELAVRNHITMYMVGKMHQIDEANTMEQPAIPTLKPIQIEDLLDREEIQVDELNIRAEIEGRVVMVTGAAGSIGSEIARQVASLGVKKLILFELSETPLHDMQLKMSAQFPNVDIKYVLGDVRSRRRVGNLIAKHKPSIIFHAAAYKHVPMIEINPCEGVMTNVWGTVNVAQRAIENGVEKFVMISTDKAVNPTNVMGATKRIAEMCVQSMNKQNKTAFITTRFGNVLGSNGSVIPLFKQQIAAGGPVTVTHPEIIRYFMSIPEACRLVLQAATMGHAGEILVFDMGKPEKIADLARKMIKLSGLEPDKDIKIEYTGLRPGEKLYEELFSTEEDMATSHKKINIAKCREVDFELIERVIKRLALHARNTEIEPTIRLMKELVPEFLSKNSKFEMFDK